MDDKRLMRVYASGQARWPRVGLKLELLKQRLEKIEADSVRNHIDLGVKWPHEDIYLASGMCSEPGTKEYEEAWSYFYAELMPLMPRFVHRHIEGLQIPRRAKERAQEDIEDIVLQRLLGAIKNYRGEARISTFLHSVVRFALKDWNRHDIKRDAEGAIVQTVSLDELCEDWLNHERASLQPDKDAGAHERMCRLVAESVCAEHYASVLPRVVEDLKPEHQLILWYQCLGPTYLTNEQVRRIFGLATNGAVNRRRNKALELVGKSLVAFDKRSSDNTEWIYECLGLERN